MMTPDDCRELDAEIAIRLFGWEWQDPPEDASLWTRTTFRSLWCRRLCPPGRGFLIEAVPSYSTRWEAAGQVLDRLADKGFVVLLKVDGEREKSSRYDVVAPPMGRVIHACESGPLAICQAALVLVGQQE